MRSSCHFFHPKVKVIMVCRISFSSCSQKKFLLQILLN
ncbi:hypothetical protein Avbf_08018 [Armadillidium vulgare]|nr:hypothetical protein Avbf_08018 [Armadillidium vulgare]